MLDQVLIRSSHSSVVADRIALGPLRHPRPLTAAELHFELEREQEAVVRMLYIKLARKWLTIFLMDRLTG